MKHFRPRLPSPTIAAITTLLACSSPPAIAAEPGREAFEQASAALAKQPVHFDFDDAVVDDEQSSVVIDHVHLAQDYPNDVLTVAGNCDERGSREYNLALGQRRAEAVKRSLMLLGIAAERIRTISFGKDRPRAACHDESCRAVNRRADIEHGWR